MINGKLSPLFIPLVVHLISIYTCSAGERAKEISAYFKVTSSASQIVLSLFKRTISFVDDDDDSEK